MTAEALAGLAGLILSLLFEYLPGLENWYGAFEATTKRLFMAGLMAVVAVVVYFLGCYTPWQWVPCDQAGIVLLIESFFAAIVANQVAHRVFKKA